MYCVGLTGTIASGKSTVAAIFTQLGIDVISADHIARQLTAADQPALAMIVAHFGHRILNDHRTLNRTALRDIIFQSPQERHWLEQLLHPLIREHILLSIQRCTSAYCIIEIPLLRNKSDYPYLNRIVWVTTEPIHQINRVMLRDQCSFEQVMAIIDSQAQSEQYGDLADDILVNNTEIADLRQHVERLHQQYLRYVNAL